MPVVPAGRFTETITAGRFRRILRRDGTQRDVTGANVKAVQKMPGHASAAITLDTYADLSEDDLDDVATALDQC